MCDDEDDIIEEIHATRVGNDAYDITPPDGTRAQRATWKEVCQIADTSGTKRILADHVLYQPAPGVRFVDLPDPSTVDRSVVTVSKP